MAVSQAVQTLKPDQLFTGGDIGWPVWLFAAVYDQFQDIFDADTVRHNLSYPLDARITSPPASPTTVGQLIPTVLIHGY
jgi:hypothetical protein